MNNYWFLNYTVLSTVYFYIYIFTGFFNDRFFFSLQGSEFAFTNHFVGQKLKGPLKSIKKSEKSKRTVTVTVVQV